MHKSLSTRLDDPCHPVPLPGCREATVPGRGKTDLPPVRLVDGDRGSRVKGADLALGFCHGDQREGTLRCVPSNAAALAPQRLTGTRRPSWLFRRTLLGTSEHSSSSSPSTEHLPLGDLRRPILIRRGCAGWYGQLAFHPPSPGTGYCVGLVLADIHESEVQCHIRPLVIDYESGKYRRDRPRFGHPLGSQVPRTRHPRSKGRPLTASVRGIARPTWPSTLQQWPPSSRR